jgi:anti-sigma factor RsiW
MKMIGCIDDATVAAFVDGTLDASARARVIGHLAACPDCSELVAEVARTDAELASSSSAVPADRSGSETVRPATVLRMRRRGLAVVGGLVALAASITLLLVNRNADIDPLVDILGDARPTLARPTGGFRPGPVSSPTRAGSDAADLRLTAEAARRVERAGQTSDADDLRAAGVALLLARDTAGALESLDSATRQADTDAHAWSDLGAALMTRFIERGDRVDADRALTSMEKALSLDESIPEAWFNKALLLERLNRRDDALVAWSRYLALPDPQGWREEAIRHRDALQRQ